MYGISTYHYDSSWFITQSCINLRSTGLEARDLSVIFQS